LVLAVAGVGVLVIVALLVPSCIDGDGSDDDGRGDACAESTIGLIRDAHAGRATAVRDALDDGADPNEHDEHDNSPLACASPRGSTEVVSALLDAGAALGTTDRFGDTVVADAVRFCHDDVLELLLDAGADPEEAGNEPSPLVQAIGQGLPDAVDLLLEAGATPDPTPDAEMLRGGEDAPDCPGPTDAGQARALTVVLEGGGDPDEVLRRAVTLEAWAAVAPALAEGADPDADQRFAWGDLGCNHTVASVVRECGAVSGVTLLRGETFEIGDDPAPTTALVHVAWAGEVEVARALIEAGADPDLVAPLGVTALAAAAGAGAGDVVDLLLPVVTLPVGHGTVVASVVAEAAGHTDLADRLRLASA
jgi:hypothetical protein